MGGGGGFFIQKISMWYMMKTWTLEFAFIYTQILKNRGGIL